MKIRLIYPRFRKFLSGHDRLRPIVEKHLVGDYTMPPSLALPIIASLTPDSVETNLTDDNRGQQIDFDEDVDLVVISCFTPQAQRAYEIADEFRSRNRKVVIGGLHPTCAPDEAGLHADAVCVGEVEPLWARILDDAARGELQPRYQTDETFDIADAPIPKRDIFNRGLYTWDAHLVYTTRGCPVRCGGCPVPLKEGALVRLRPVDRIIDDIKSMPYREFYFTDDTVMLPGKKYQKFLLRIMERTAEMDVSIFLASTMMMVRDPEFYRKLARGGASSMYTVFGFDRDSKLLFSPDCPKSHWDDCVDLVKMNEDAGIHFFASLGIGFDDQDRGVPDRMLKFCKDANIDLAEFYINTPFPGTPFGKLCEQEGRILHRNYNLWNTGNVVFKPAFCSPEELLEDFFYLWENFYKDKQPENTLRTFELGSDATVNK